MSRGFVVERAGPVLEITLDRPERRNAFTLAMMTGIADVVAEAGGDMDIRAVILTGGRNCFSAGMDLHEAKSLRCADEVTRGAKTWQQLNGALESSRLPIIAAIEGPCYTGGCEVALACDVRFAGEGAQFAITSARIGSVPGAGATQRLPRLVGIGHALALMLGADPIDAHEALRIGLVNAVTPRGAALERARSFAAIVAQRAPLSLGAIKRAVREGLQMDLAQGLALETQFGATLAASADRDEGLAAFLEKRAPRFTGR